MSLKNPVTLPGIDPGTVRLVGRRLNYSTTPAPKSFIVLTQFMVMAAALVMHRGLSRVGHPWFKA